MHLREYNNQCVRITLTDGSVFEGVCEYDPYKYGLEIAGWMFYHCEIEKVELIDESNPFLAPFGTIEEETLLNGMYAIKHTLIDDDQRNAVRLLNCIEYYLNQPAGSSDPFSRRTLKTILEQTVQCATDAIVVEKAHMLLAILT